MANYQSAYTGAQHDTYVTKQQLVDLMYPVGAVYISTSSTSPQALFGGTWTAIEGQFLVGASSVFTAGSSGGADKHTHTYSHTHTTPATTTGSHTLTIAEMPSHLHLQAYKWTSGGSASKTRNEPWAITMTSGDGNGVGTWPYGTDTGSGADNFGYTGGGGQPYPPTSCYYYKLSKYDNYKRNLKSPSLPYRIYVEAHGVTSQEVSADG